VQRLAGVVLAIEFDEETYARPAQIHPSDEQSVLDDLELAGWLTEAGNAASELNHQGLEQALRRGRSCRATIQDPAHAGYTWCPGCTQTRKISYESIDGDETPPKR